MASNTSAAVRACCSWLVKPQSNDKAYAGDSTRSWPITSTATSTCLAIAQAKIAGRGP